MIAPITSKALLDVATVLTRIDDPSTTVHLRRAISSAYYALFHGLVTAATRSAMGDEPARADDRFVMSRWYGHSEIRSASEWVVRRAHGRAVPKEVAQLLDAPPAELVEVADTFVELLHARHAADYDHRAKVDSDDAVEAVASARTALGRLDLLSGTRAYENYLVLIGAARRVVR